MEILSLAIVGAAVSVLVQFLKKEAQTSGWKTVVLSIAVSLIAAVIYYFASNTVFWTTFLKILAIANTIYGLLIKQME